MKMAFYRIIPHVLPRFTFLPEILLLYGWQDVNVVESRSDTTTIITKNFSSLLMV